MSPAGRFSGSPWGRLEPQVFSQEHGQDAAQVVYCGWVQVGLGVIRRVPDGGEGCGDEVEHGNSCRAKRRQQARVWPPADPGAQAHPWGSLPSLPPPPNCAT